MALFEGLGRLATAPRRTVWLAATAGLVGLIYVLATFDLAFLAGHGGFWDYPVGPWLIDSADQQDNFDVLDYLVGYTGLVRSHWTLPLFYVPVIGAPAGTNVVFLDIVPVVALLGRIVSDVSGVLVIPYGAWIAICFILSAVFAALVLAEAGQRSILAAIAAALLAVSAPSLLHRFAHFPLMAHFLVIGALYLYLREQRAFSPWARAICWGGWLVLSLLTNPYLFAMVSAIYAAGLLRSWRLHGLRSRLLEPAAIGFAVAVTMVAAGFVGSGNSFSGFGYGWYSMNLLSPFYPQRSGLFAGRQAIVDATSGQYEGFNYLGFGALVLIVAALLFNPTGIKSCVTKHFELTGVLILLTLYAVSNHVFFGNYEILDVDIGWRLGQLVGIYRSSGRMFWPVYYALLLGGLLLALRGLPRAWQLPVVAVCCLLQLADTEPLRARLTTLTAERRSPLLDATAWSDRVDRARFVDIYPTYFCSDDKQQAADLELQLMAVRADKPFNTSYNPRLNPDCHAEMQASLKGPWAADTLYVFLSGQFPLPNDWTPPGLLCHEFSEGRWCLGRNTAAGS